MNQLLCRIAAVALLTSLVACGGGGNSPEPAPVPPPAPVTPIPAPPSTPPPAPSPEAQFIVQPVKEISLITGNPDVAGYADGDLLSARYINPGPMTWDAGGNLYVSQGFNWRPSDHFLIKKISPNGQVSNIAGSFYAYGKYDNSYLGGITGIAFNAVDGNLYASSVRGIVLQITSKGVVSVWAGKTNGTGSFKQGFRTDAQLSQLWGITSDDVGNLYASMGSAIVQISKEGSVSVYAGKPDELGSADGGRLNARFKYLDKLFYKNGKIYTADQVGLRIIDSSGNVTTLVDLKKMMIDVCGSSGVDNRLSGSGIDIAPNGDIAVSNANCDGIAIYSKDGQFRKRIGSFKDYGDGKTWHVRGERLGANSQSALFFPAGIYFKSQDELIFAEIGNNNLKKYNFIGDRVDLFSGALSGSDNPVFGSKSVARISPVSGLYVGANRYWFSQSRINEGAAQSVVDLNGGVSNAGWPKGFVLADTLSGIFYLNMESYRIEKYPSINSMPTSQYDIKLIAGSDYHFGGYSLFLEGKSEILLCFEKDQNKKIVSYSMKSNVATIKPWSSSVCPKAVKSNGKFVGTDFDAIYELDDAGQAVQIAGGIKKLGPDGPAGKAGMVGADFWSPIAIGADDAIYFADWMNGTVRRLKDGQVTTVVGTPALFNTTLGSGQTSLGDVKGMGYEKSSNSLIILTPYALLRANL